MEFRHLFSPININGMALKNRIVMSAFHLGYTQGGYVNERLTEFYCRRAEGGAGLIVLGGCRFDEYGAKDDMPSFADDKFIPGYRDFAEKIHQRGAKLAAQLYHAGRYTYTKDVPKGELPLAPSAVASSFTRETPREMALEDIQRVIQKWAEGAARVQAAGFDAVEISASAGYLISQFLSPTTNHRTDSYGGSLENRMRFPAEVVKAVRGAVGPNFPIILRMGGSDFVPGANTSTEAVAFAKAMEAAGVDLLSVTGGWHETVIPQLPGDLPPGGFGYLAHAVKQAVSIPVIACNRINTPAVAEEILAMGCGDLVGAVRAFVADPEWANKAEQNRPGEIRRCVACLQGCLSKTFFNKPVECLVNPLAGREYEVTIAPARAPKKLLVVGAGPAGMEVAVTAAQRGHQVTVWEKEHKIGGQLHLVAAPPGKKEFAAMIAYYEAMAKKLNISVELGREATRESLENGGFDEVILATGAVPNRVPLPCEEAFEQIALANDILSGRQIAGKNVVIVGGSSVGCEAAQFLARRGALSPELLHFLMAHNAETPERIGSLLGKSMRNITIVEIREKIGTGFDRGTGWPVLKDLKRLGVRLLAKAQIVELKKDWAIVRKEGENGAELLEIPCDTVVLAVGSKPNNSLYKQLEGSGPFHVVGDAARIGKALDAVREGARLGAAL